MKENMQRFDASRKFDISNSVNKQENLCIAGEILKGIKTCRMPTVWENMQPSKSIGRTYGFSEGACAAYYHHS